VSETVLKHLRLTKLHLVERAGDGRVSQSGATVVDSGFPVPEIDPALPHALPSIETFVVAQADRSISSMGVNGPLNEAWMPTVEALASTVFQWLDERGVALHGDAYITASITRANEVSSEAHFDDDQFAPADGVGVVAIVADRDGSRVANSAVLLEGVRAPRPLVLDDDLKAAFVDGAIDQDRFGAHTLVLFPQFGQLHSGPGPCGSADEVRHLLVFRGSTLPPLASPSGSKHRRLAI
jgi:hypothetical protein